MKQVPFTTLQCHGADAPIAIDVRDLERLQANSRVVLSQLSLGRYHGEDGYVYARLINDPRGNLRAALAALVARPPRDHRVRHLNGNLLDLRYGNLVVEPVPAKAAA